MITETIVAVAFFGVCTVVMHQMSWMLEQCVPTSQETISKARARCWKSIVAAVVVGAWVCAGGIALGVGMPKTLWAVVFAGPVAVTFPVLVWVFLVYWLPSRTKRRVSHGLTGAPASILRVAYQEHSRVADRMSFGHNRAVACRKQIGSCKSRKGDGP